MKRSTISATALAAGRGASKDTAPKTRPSIRQVDKCFARFTDTSVALLNAGNQDNDTMKRLSSRILSRPKYQESVMRRNPGAELGGVIEGPGHMTNSRALANDQAVL